MIHSKKVNKIRIKFHSPIIRIMTEDLSNIEWCFYNIDKHDYSFSLNKETLNKIKNWENAEMVMYHYTSHSNSIESIQEWMKKTLILWLLSNKDRQERETNADVRNHFRDSKEVTINISNELIENLLKFKWSVFWNGYHCRYNKYTRDKMIFYVNDSFEKECLQNDIDFYNQLFDKKFPKK